MEHPRLVKDVMVPAMRLDAKMRSVDALQVLDQRNIEYGVVCDQAGKPSTIISREQLRAAEPDESLHVLNTYIPYPVSIDPDDNLNSIVQMLAEDVTCQYESTDLIVQKQGNIQGILIYQTLMSLFRPRGDSLRVPPTMIFQCSICKAKRSVEYKDYDRNNPPMCHGQEMHRIK
jgi:CBS-domain-containing membrane protein